MTPTNPGQLVLEIYNFALIAGGLLAFGAIVYGAIMYGLSGGNSSLASDAKDQITQAVLGLLLLFGAYLILHIVNPELTNLALPTPAALTIPATGTPPPATVPSPTPSSPNQCGNITCSDPAAPRCVISPDTGSARCAP